MTYKTIPEITLKFSAGEIVNKAITKSSDAADLLRKMYDSDTLEYYESSIAIYLNRANKSIGWQKISQGGLASTIIDVRVVLGTALKSGATAIIISHNHPSGQLVASQADKAITKKLNEACKIMDINLLDHIIITKEDYYSFSDNSEL